MPSSVRFVASLLALAAIGAVVALSVLWYEDRHRARVVAEQIAGGSVEAGKQAIGRLGCATCHAIPGFEGPKGLVGPSLDGFASRAQIAGVLANDPDHLVRWLRAPQQVLPGNGMPDQGIGDADARDLAAYLYTLRKD